MTVVDFVFFLFALCLLVGGIFTVVSRSPVHSVLWLILAFLSGAGLMVLLGAEFVAMLLIIVYVGAVMVLFLFVVMMLDVDFAELRAEMAKQLPLALVIGLVLIMQLAMAFGSWELGGGVAILDAPVATPAGTGAHNTAALGMLIYDRYFLLFQLAGLILLVAMIGAIVLTMRHRRDIKRQDILQQMYRDPKKTMELVDIEPGQGLK
ncbi:NADH-quinone oxidoreductase subunit J [Tropicimonas sp. IMCC6043]|uniref:NADH-quinone oxidoreductase subunit J n=1 Tax=Tropicimonas sp. IMCC6043 TaxID=2510645 RepID=UPI00101D6351|nr:NADH-quinone oxidoreductase subunit J [Tropicimonas sp. IMCC6043]RYH12348.1 NADH-quinone oxidoreductase subunit J [Tropicimonas sp. IMCC6043]